MDKFPLIALTGIGGHGGCGIHADLESKYEEVIGRVSSHVTPHFHKPVSFNMDYYKKCEDMRSPEHPQSTLIIPRYNPNTMLPLQRRQGSLEAVRMPTRNEEETNPPNYSNTVEQVHVTKCAVCTIL